MKMIIRTLALTVLVIGCLNTSATPTVDAEVITGNPWQQVVASSHNHTRSSGDPNITSNGTLTSTDQGQLFSGNDTLTSPETADNWGSGDKAATCGDFYFARTKITSPSYDPPIQKTDATQFGCTPLIVDLGRDGILLGEEGVYIEFDLDADGSSESTQWVMQGGNEAFIALDLNKNGVIDDSSELFGDSTVIIGRGYTARHGFMALAQYDKPKNGGNKDGKISEADAIWSSLVFWLDSNADGISTPDEISHVSDHGFESFRTKAKKSKRVDHAGNQLILWSWAKSRLGMHAVVDVVFVLE